MAAEMSLITCNLFDFNPIALRMAKTLGSIGVLSAIGLTVLLLSISCYLPGGNLRTLADDSSTISHVFGLAVLENVLLYSDWDTNSVRMVDMESEFRTSLVTNLTRPTAIMLYHPDKFSGKSLNGIPSFILLLQWAHFIVTIFAPENFGT